MSRLLDKLQELGLVQMAKALFTSPDTERGEPSHALSRHTPIWSFCSPDMARPFVESYRDKPLYEILPHTASISEVTSQTHFICLFGAASSAVMDELTGSPAVKIVFEPDTDTLLRHLETQDLASLIKNRFFFFTGDFRANGWDLDGVIPKSLTDLGFPTMYIQAGRERRADYFSEIIKRLEFLYFRNKIVPAIGQQGTRGKPYRPLHKSLFYDQQRHLFQNIMHLVTGGNPRHLDNVHDGTALLIGAGPGLKRRHDLALNPGDALTIAVNSAYGFCLGNGIQPDITLISDTSVDAAKTLQGWEGHNEGILFGHWASGLGDGHFSKRYVGWEFYPEVFGNRPEPQSYGSVMSATFGLADLIGVKECVMTGFHMATEDPRGFSYASGETGKYYSANGESAPNYRYPDLYPVQGADGRPMYTSLNFYDATMFVLDSIRKTGVNVINTAPDSIIHGDNITVDPDYTSPPGTGRPLPKQLRETIRDPLDLVRVNAAVGEWMHFWQLNLETAQRFAGTTKPGAKDLIEAEKKIAEYDGNNVSYLLQRFDTFSNALFHEQYFDGKQTSTRLQGAIYYFDHLQRMSREFLDILGGQREQLQALIQAQGTHY